MYRSVPPATLTSPPQTDIFYGHLLLKTPFVLAQKLRTVKIATEKFGSCYIWRYRPSALCHNCPILQRVISVQSQAKQTIILSEVHPEILP